MGMNKSAGIKSVTRGIISIGNTQLTATATIAAVNLSKTELRFVGVEGNNATTAASDVSTRLYMNNATTVGAIRGNSNGAITVTYEITEWY